MKPPSTATAVRDIFRSSGFFGLYTGFNLHFREFVFFAITHEEPLTLHIVRDTAGTALYFLEYDGMRHILGRLPSGEQGPTPIWFPVHPNLVPFVCGSLSGVTSWALIYPMDV